MLKRLSMILATVALILGAVAFAPVASTPPLAMTMVNQTPMAPDMSCKDLPPCCMDGLGCTGSALLPLPQTLPVVVRHFYSFSPRFVAALNGITIEPELSPPIHAL
ncbi:MAG: hypothetical protein ACREEL_12825 [Stellaceae bacterium]